MHPYDVLNIRSGGVMRHRLVVLLTALLVVLGFVLSGTVAQAKPKPTPPPSTSAGYVALGDSYASGAGLTPYSDSTCFRSATQAYPSLLTGRKMTLTFTACSGATIPTMLASQLAVVPTASYVTVTIGGNDVGFREVLSDCIDSPFTDGCSTTGMAAAEAAVTALPKTLIPALQEIQATYPNATVFVSGYPELFGDLTGTCRVGTYAGWMPLEIGQEDGRWLNEMAGNLNAAIRSASDTAGVRYADAQATFDGHGLCDTGTAWVNGPIITSLFPLTVSERSFHPTADGQKLGYRTAFVDAGFPPR
jgi:lysophospholipase L1-like esterase